MKHDIFLGTIMAGCLAGIISTFTSLALVAIGFHNTSIVTVAAGIFLPAEQIFTTLGTVFGILGHLVISCIWSVVFYVLFILFGTDKSIYKGFIFSFFIWFFGTEMMRWNATNYIVFGGSEQLGLLIHDIVFCTTLGYFVPVFSLKGASKSYFTGLLEQNLLGAAYKPLNDTGKSSINNENDE
ncbi:MAG: hypothetical protein H6Q74_2095 [Firmicutes bacterium]|nr:hypothetical protein [Bacillota bacterium]